MPAPSSPPFEAGALLQPRQLQRWLDVNKVNRLTRAETYFIIPAFNIVGIPTESFSLIAQDGSFIMAQDGSNLVTQAS